MARKLRNHFRANVVGYAALVVAVIGVPTTWAVAKNSVGSKQIRPQGVRSGDIANGAVTSKKVADGSLNADDFTVSPPLGEGETTTRTTVTVRGGKPRKPATCHADEQLIGGATRGELTVYVDQEDLRRITESTGGFLGFGSTPPSSSAELLSWRSVPVTAAGLVPNADFTPHGWLSKSSSGFGDVALAICAKWAEPAQGPPGSPGPPGPPGEIADQQCPANQFVHGFTDGQIDCAVVEIIGAP